MKKSPRRKDQNTLQHSTQDALQLSLIQQERKYSIDDAFQVATILLECIAFEIMSGDKLKLAIGRAENYRPENISENDYKNLLEMLLERMQVMGRTNIMSRMF